MKKNILIVLIILFFIGCTTVGTHTVNKHDTNIGYEVLVWVAFSIVTAYTVNNYIEQQ